MLIIYESINNLLNNISDNVFIFIISVSDIINYMTMKYTYIFSFKYLNLYLFYI